MDIDFAAVHRVARRLLGVPVHMDGAAVQITAKGVSGRAVDNDILPGKRACDIALSRTAVDCNLPVARFPYQAVELFKMHQVRLYLHSVIPPSVLALSRFEKAINCGFSLISSKSIVERLFF